MCQDYLSASSDLQEVLQLDPNVREAEQELEVVTGLLRESLMNSTAAHTPRVRRLQTHTLLPSLTIFRKWLFELQKSIN